MPDFSEMKTLRLKIVKQCSRQKFLWSFIGTGKSMLQIWSTRFTLLYSLYSFYFFWAFVIKLYFLFLYIIISRGQSPPIPFKKNSMLRENSIWCCEHACVKIKLSSMNMKIVYHNIMLYPLLWLKLNELLAWWSST
jgi:hypothetical protein